MADGISDAVIEYVSALAGLELTEEEKVQAGRDMGRMLDFIDRLNELDTTGTEPLTHVLPTVNVLREDQVTNGDESGKILRNAPQQRDHMFAVPRTF